MGPGVGQLKLPSAAPAAVALEAAHDLGLAYERELDASARSAGAHYTPIDVALRLAERVIVDGGPGTGTGGPAAIGSGAGDLPTVWDPSCGAGALLLAAAEVLRRAGHDPGLIVRDLLWGMDTDPAAVAVAEAALVLWATLHGAPEARPGDHLRVGDALSERPPRGGVHRYVVGNPPFQGQLTGGSVRGDGHRARLRGVWGDVLGPYTDTSTVFLVAATHALVPGGRLGMILPTSVLAARDATAARRHLDEVADLIGLWVATEPVFAASVEVCAPVLVRRGSTGGPQHGSSALPSPTEPVRRWRGRGFDELAPTVRAGRRWSELALAAHDVPFPAHRSDGRLGDVAVASSGFRDEYYGLVPHVHDLPRPRRPQPGLTGEGSTDQRVGPRPLVTSGLIDPGRCRWGDRTVRFAKQTFDRPVVAVDELLVAAAAAPGSPVARAAAWVAATSGPKVVVATQTRVGEAAVDETGSWVPSTPTIAVRGIDDTAGSVPGDTEIDRLWALAAVICSPLGTVAALADTFGTARSVQAIKPSATSVLDLPLPADPDAWLAGAGALRSHDREAFTDAMATAYGILGGDAVALQVWWVARAPW